MHAPPGEPQAGAGGGVGVGVGVGLGVGFGVGVGVGVGLGEGVVLLLGVDDPPLDVLVLFWESLLVGVVELLFEVFC